LFNNYYIVILVFIRLESLSFMSLKDHTPHVLLATGSSGTGQLNLFNMNGVLTAIWYCTIFTRS
jgi:hypothetical protein